MEGVGYFVRLDAREGYLEKINAMQLLYDVVLCVHHVGTNKENPHYHIIVKTSIQNQTFRKRLKATFTDGKGNGHMSIKDWDGKIEAVSYMFHEDPSAKLLIQRGVTEDYISKAREVNLKVRALVQESKEKASWKIEDEVFNSLDKKKSYNEVMIATHVYLVAFRSGKYPPQPHHCKVMTQKIMFRLLDGDERQEEKYARQLAENIFRF